MTDRQLSPYPFDLPGFDQLPAPPDAAWLRRTRRKLDAEFELQSSVTIEVNGKEADKATLLKILEELEDPVKAAFYFRMGKDQPIRHFLESGRVEEDWDDDPKSPESALEQQLWDETLTAPLQAAFYQAFKSNEILQIKKLMPLYRILSIPAQDKAIEGIRRWVWNLIQELLALQENPNFPQNTGNHRHLWKSESLVCLNLFGQTLFDLRCRLALALGNLANAINNTESYFYSASRICTAALQLDIDPQLREDIRKLQTITDHNRGEKTKEDRKNPRRRVHFGGILLIVYFLARIANSGGCFDSQPDYYSRNVYKSYYDVRKPKQLDSLLGSYYSTPPSVSVKRAQALFSDLMQGEYEGRVSQKALKKWKVDPRIETGARVYPQLNKPPQNSGLFDGRVTFISKAPVDMVIFLQRGYSEGVLDHFYLPAGETYTRTDLPIGGYKILLYAGKYPGFTQMEDSTEQFVFFREAVHKLDSPILRCQLSQKSLSSRIVRIEIDAELKARQYSGLHFKPGG